MVGMPFCLLVHIDEIFFETGDRVLSGRTKAAHIGLCAVRTVSALWHHVPLADLALGLDRLLDLV